ncbi:hypothetical protein CDCA_CDCA09G2621 [Cyanidium caldarium]|uniref:Sugar phosphate transporter domain-containing protein n=1 Tax=Cyanidium caldarium TaxID=2771 RepID=A0AAV9IWV3_CYACA|nr:hypothetical protein CDCA_CDCA09G2621 [Cyanidium caldarium]
MATILVNKFCFHNLRFHFPVTLTCVHLLFQALFCVVSMDVLQWLPRKRLDRSAYLQRVVPIAAAFAANIAAGNVSLRHVPVSFNQTIKSLTPLTTAMVQYECTRRRLTVAASLSLVPVVGGVALGSATELSWHTWGFFSGVISCFFTGAKFVLSHELLRGQYMLTPLQLVSLVAPAATVMLLPLAVYSEGRAAYTWFVRAGSDPQFLPTLDPTTPATAAMRAAAWIHLASPAGVRLVVLMPLFSGLVALLLNITSFAVLQRTSSVTVTIAGNLKTCLLIGWSILLFQNPVTPLNLFGCVLAVLGCLWHGLLPRKWHIEEAKGG